MFGRMAVFGVMWHVVEGDYRLVMEKDQTRTAGPDDAQYEQDDERESPLRFQPNFQLKRLCHEWR